MRKKRKREKLGYSVFWLQSEKIMLKIVRNVGEKVQWTINYLIKVNPDCGEFTTHSQSKRVSVETSSTRNEEEIAPERPHTIVRDDMLEENWREKSYESPVLQSHESESRNSSVSVSRESEVTFSIFNQPKVFW